MLSFLNKKSPNKGTLVLSTDGFSLQATVLTGNRNNLTVVAVANSRETEPVAALTDVITQLKNSLGKKLPSNTLLLHVNAIPNHVEITQDPNSTSSSSLAELMRWEMEGVVAEQSPLWQLGWLLMGRGYITEAQRAELVQLVLDEKRLSGKHGGRSAMRLGEIAVREKMATQEQVSECLQLQEKLHLPDQRLLTQWRPLPTAETIDEYSFENEEDNSVGSSFYLCSAMPVTNHLQWVHAVKKVSSQVGMPRLHLRQVYPFAGSTAPLLEGMEGSILLTEFHSAYLYCAVIENGQIQDMAMLKSSSHALDLQLVADALQNLLPNKPEQWVVANLCNQPMTFIEQLEETLELKADFLPKVSTATLTEHSSEKVNSLAEFGVLSHFLGRAPLIMSPLAGMPPPEPFYKGEAAKVAMAVAVIPITIASFELYSYLDIEKLRTKHAEEEKTLAKYESIKVASRQDLENAKTDIERYQIFEKELYGLKYRKQLVEQVLVKRELFMQQLFPLLSRSMNNGIIIDSMTETNWYQFSITGKAIDQASIDSFNRILSINLEPYEMFIASSPSGLENNTSTLSQSGLYFFEFELQRKAVQ